MSTQVISSSPILLDRLDTEAFRRKLAGLADPSQSQGALAPAVIRETAKRYCSILAKLFGSSLDRETLWDRINTAIVTALAQVSDDDFDKFVNICLEKIEADPAQAAACEPLGAVISTMHAAKPEDRLSLMAYIRDHRLPVIVHSRARWKQVLAKEIEL